MHGLLLQAGAAWRPRSVQPWAGAGGTPGTVPWPGAACSAMEPSAPPGSLEGPMSLRRKRGSAERSWYTGREGGSGRGPQSFHQVSGLTPLGVRIKGQSHTALSPGGAPIGPDPQPGEGQGSRTVCPNCPQVHSSGGAGTSGPFQSPGPPLGRLRGLCPDWGGVGLSRCPQGPAWGKPQGPQMGASGPSAHPVPPPLRQVPSGPRPHRGECPGAAATDGAQSRPLPGR